MRMTPALLLIATLLLAAWLWPAPAEEPGLDPAALLRAEPTAAGAQAAPLQPAASQPAPPAPDAQTHPAAPMASASQPQAH